MKKSFSGRRVPRKVGQDDEEDVSESNNSDSSGPISAVKRPSSKPRKSSHLRHSFGLSATDDDDTELSSVVTPKRLQLSKIAVQRSASQRSSNLASQLPLRTLDDDDDRPNYNAASLRELKDSTPSTPRDNSEATISTQLVSNPSAAKDLDLVSKFGSSLSRYEQPSAIPSAAEIAEKKARRARLAMEEKADEYISLNPSDPELDDDDDENTTTDAYGRLILKPKDKYGKMESRLVRDDEDIMENFDEFTEDGRISLGRKAEAEAARRRKEEMAAQIAAAEGASDSDSNTSDRERNAAFEAAQTKHGTYGQNAPSSDSHVDERPKTPPIISPLPTLDGVLERLRSQLSALQTSRMQKLQEMEALQREKVRLGEEEVRIQNALKETAQKFEELRKEKGITVEKNVAADVIPVSVTDGGVDNEAHSVKAEDHDTGEEEVGTRLPELGYGGMRRGLGTAGLGMPADEASDSDDY